MKLQIQFLLLMSVLALSYRERCSFLVDKGLDLWGTTVGRATFWNSIQTHHKSCLALLWWQGKHSQREHCESQMFGWAVRLLMSCIVGLWQEAVRCGIHRTVHAGEVGPASVVREVSYATASHISEGRKYSHLTSFCPLDEGKQKTEDRNRNMNPTERDQQSF